MSSKFGVLILIVVLFLLFILSAIFVFLEDIRGLFVGLFKKIRVNQKLKKFAIDRDFPLLSNVVLSVGKDKAIKIDYIIIGNKYIYVLTSKCYYGYLQGKIVDDKWLLYRGHKLTHIDNPIINNRIRIKYLNKLLNNSADDFVNIVYLSKPVIVNEIETDNNKEFAIYENDFCKFIDMYEKQSELNEFTLKSVEGAAKKIFDYHNKSMIKFKKLN